MPRHRRERVFWHRAQRSADDAARGVPMAAVFSDADAEATLPMRLLQIGVASPSVVAAAVRGLLATPWFAAATGCVVAAGLWIYSPHVEVKFGQSMPDRQSCDPASGCPISTPNGSPATAGGQQATQGGGTGAATSATQAVVRRLKFTYTVLSAPDGKFAVRITVLGKRPPRSWSLALTMTDDRISGVLGAGWDPSGAGSGVATGPPPDQSQWQGAGHGTDSGGGSLMVQIPPRRGFTFVVFGYGTPVMPTGCTLNEAACTFSPSGA